MTDDQRRHVPIRYLVVAALAVMAVLGATIGAGLLPGGDTSPKDRIEADPPPALYPAAAIAGTERDVGSEVPRAHALMTQWFATHGTSRDDAAFAKWLETRVPAPPSVAERTAEVGRVEALAKTRTKAGVAAATWLEEYGKKDLWKLYAHDQAEMLPAKEGEARKADVKAMLKLAKQVADDLGLHYRQSAPYVLHPWLRPDHTVTKGQVCPCSYPSRHAAGGAAVTTYLGGLDPERREQYLWTQGQIDWSRVYMAGHVPSDLRGGALLGDMIGEYYLRTRS